MPTARCRPGPWVRLIPVLGQMSRDLPAVAHGFHEAVIARFRAAIRSLCEEARRAGIHRPLPAHDADQIVLGLLIGDAMTTSLLPGTWKHTARNLEGTVVPPSST